MVMVLLFERDDEAVVSELELEVVGGRDSGELGEAQAAYSERVRGCEVRDDVENEGLIEILERDGGGDESLGGSAKHGGRVARIPEHINRGSCDCNTQFIGVGNGSRVAGSYSNGSNGSCTCPYFKNLITPRRDGGIGQESPTDIIASINT